MHGVRWNWKRMCMGVGGGGEGGKTRIVQRQSAVVVEWLGHRTPTVVDQDLCLDQF